MISPISPVGNSRAVSNDAIASVVASMIFAETVENGVPTHVPAPARVFAAVCSNTSPPEIEQTGSDSVAPKGV